MKAMVWSMTHIFSCYRTRQLRKIEMKKKVSCALTMQNEMHRKNGSHAPSKMCPSGGAMAIFAPLYLGEGQEAAV